MVKTIYQHPTWSVVTKAKLYNGRVETSAPSARDRYVEYAQINDGTPTKEDKPKLQIKAKRQVLLKVKFTKHGIKPIVKEFNSTQASDKSKRLTRKSDVRKNYPSYVRGVDIVDLCARRKFIPLTRDCIHTRIQGIPFVEGNDPVFHVSGGYAAYLKSDGEAHLQNPVVVMPNFAQDVRTNCNADLLRLASKFDIDPVLWQRIIKNALPRPESFLPCVNVIAMLVELKETLKYIKQTKDLAKLISDAVINRTARKGDAAANARLWWAFGTSPTASDIAGLLGLLLCFRDLISAYNKLANSRIYTIHRTVIRRNYDEKDFSELAKASYMHGNGNYLQFASMDQNFSGEGVGKLTFKIRLKPLSSTWTARILEHCLGLDAIILGLWEGVPFSWLIDYFVNTAEVLEFYTSTELILPYEIVDASFSRKVSGLGQKNMIFQYGLPYKVAPQGLYRYINGVKVYYVSPGGLLHEKQEAQVNGNVTFNFSYYRRNNVTSLVRRYANDDYYQMTAFRKKVPKIGQLANMASVGYLQARKAEDAAIASDASAKRKRDTNTKRILANARKKRKLPIVKI